MTLKMAKKKLAKLMVALADYHDTHFGLGTIGLPKDISDTTKVEYELLQRKVRQLGEELYAMPEFFDVIQPWMVDVIGVEGEGDMTGHEPLQVIAETTNPDEIMERFTDIINKQGALAESIQRHIVDNGFVISDRGANGKSWHLGVPCNEPESRRLCTIIHNDFRRAIKSGIIRVQRRFWGFKFDGLRNFDDARRVLEDQ